MATATAEVSEAQRVYHAAVEDWVNAIRTEERLVSTTDSVAKVDQWEQAHDAEEAARNRAVAAKEDFEAALRQKFFEFK